MAEQKLTQEEVNLIVKMHVKSGAAPALYKSIAEDTDFLLTKMDQWLQVAKFAIEKPQIIDHGTFRDDFSALTLAFCAVCDTGPVRIDSKPLIDFVYRVFRLGLRSEDEGLEVLCEAGGVLERLVWGRMLLEGRDPGDISSVHDPRDKYIYDERHKKPPTPYSAILKHIRSVKGWANLGSDNACRQAADRYAERKRVPPIPKNS